MKRFTISVQDGTKELMDKNALKKTGGNVSRHIEEVYNNYYELQDLYHSATKVISCVVVGETQTEPGFDKFVKEYKKKRDKYFQK